MVEGVCVQTETVLRQALAERIRPVLTINKVDRGFLELQLSPEAMYQNFVKVIENTNVVLATYQDEALGECFLDPLQGTVGFSSGYQGWGFTLHKFARMYAAKLGSDPAKLVKHLWGDHFYDAEAKKWTTSSVSETGQPLPRGFCKFILEPIGDMINAVMKEDAEKLAKCLKGAGVTLTSEEAKQTDKKAMLRTIMQKWLPADEALLEMICLKLPSPAEAQKYRCELLYTGPMDDPTSQAISNCDSNGPVRFLVKYLFRYLILSFFELDVHVCVKNGADE